MKGAADPGPVVAAEGTDSLDHGRDVVPTDLACDEQPVARSDPGEWAPTKVHDDLGEGPPLPVEAAHGGGDVEGEEGEEEFEVVDLLAKRGGREEWRDAHAGPWCPTAVVG